MNDVSEKLAQLRRGLLEVAVLSVVSGGQVYAADILAALRRTDLATGEGTLYPLLSRLRREGLIDYAWVESEAGPPRKYYQLTDTGRWQLDQMRTYWQELTTTITRLGGADEQSS